jgi:dTDP-4-amino-4,6-dideoxygalactose transaminase
MQTIQKVTRIPFVDLKSQYLSIKEEIDEAIASVLDQTAFIGGAQVKAFEEAFAAYCGVNHCVGVANGTDALFIALRTLGIGPGDEVITAANSFVATSEAIKMAGAQVVFVDVDPATYNIDVTQVEAKVTARTKAIIPVHLYGQPADMDPLRAIAASHGLRIVGDAAQAHGALYKGQPIASLADITCYSFYPGKNLGAYGDAGALVTNNAEWAASARMFANHGRSDKYNHAFEGVNSRLDGLQAAILNVKLRHIETWTEQRRRAAESYRRALAARKVTVPQELDDVRAVYHLFVVRVPAERREALQAHLKEAGIETGVHYPIALPLLTAYKHLEHTAADFPFAAKASQEIVSLPIFPELTDEQVDYVAGRLEEFGL